MTNALVFFSDTVAGFRNMYKAIDSDTAGVLIGKPAKYIGNNIVSK